jgi:hypothetical protein
MPVWGVWDDTSLLFSSGGRSRKTRNLAADTRCVVTTENANEPVIIECAAAVIEDRDTIARVAELLSGKYGEGITVDFPLANGTLAVRPRWAFAIAHDDFTGSPRPVGSSTQADAVAARGDRDIQSIIPRAVTHSRWRRP